MRKYKPKLKNLPARYEAGFIGRMDRRADLTRRLLYTYDSITADCGGADAVPHAKRCLIERFAFLEEFLRRIEAELVKGEVNPELLGRWVQGVNSMVGLTKLLGANRDRRESVLDALYSDPGPDEKEKGGNDDGTS
ncbi:MAG: hypothetical protein KKE86_07620 [Planctomycetes bacterium]|nr:hypothetical protein [Planctomycetota bacterium]MBU4399188.1 hypothetical protein [Planctomycetota bacterium]MCG2682891.1 hypothetical protein [Planctomycetales bacterium]